MEHKVDCRMCELLLKMAAMHSDEIIAWQMTVRRPWIEQWTRLQILNYKETRLERVEDNPVILENSNVDLMRKKYCKLIARAGV